MPAHLDECVQMHMKLLHESCRKLKEQHTKEIKEVKEEMLAHMERLREELKDQHSFHRKEGNVGTFSLRRTSSLPIALTSWQVAREHSLSQTGVRPISSTVALTSLLN